MQHLKLKDFFSDITAYWKITFDCNTIMRFLFYARILNPSSKYFTQEHHDNYYEKPHLEY